MARKNAFDEEANALAQQMKDASEELAATADGVEPFDSRPVADEQMMLYFRNPAAFYPEAAGQITNAEAAQMMLEDMGPVEYVAFCEKMAGLEAKGTI